VSRLLLAREIAGWTGEIWGCNLAYREPGVCERLARLTGHVAILGDADAYRMEHGLQFEIWAGNLGKHPPHWRAFTCPAEHRKDSGTTLAAQALHEGRSVIAAGFDLGGPDIHSPRLWTQNKSSWVKRWRDIGQRYGWDRLTFWGYDHKPFLVSSASASTYQRLYRSGVAHIPGEEYRKLFEQQYGAEVRECPEEDRVVKFLWEGQAAPVDMKRSIAVIFEQRGRGKIIPPLSVDQPEVSEPPPQNPPVAPLASRVIELVAEEPREVPAASRGARRARSRR